MKKKRNNYTGMLFILPSFLGVAIFVLIPFLDVVRRSFTSVITNQWIGMQNYLTVFQTKGFQQASANTLRFLAVCMPALIICSLLLSVFLSNQNRVGEILKSAYLLPMAIPVASVVIMWRILFSKQGIISGILMVFGIEPVDWMNSKYAFWILVISYIWKNIGYNIVLWMAGLSVIPGSVYEAARVDGAGSVQIFFRITLPNLWKVFYTILILSLLNSFKMFREAYLIGGDYPDESMYMLQHLFNNWYRELSLDKLAAAAVLVALVITIFVLRLKKVFYEE